VAIDPDIAGRVALGLMILSAASIGIPFRLRADRAGGPVSRRNDPRWFWIGMSIVGPPLALTCLAFLIQPRWVVLTKFELPIWMRWLGVAIALSGVALFGWMFRHLGLNVTSTSMPRAKATLVTTGPYRWIRHPMYSAALLLVIAAALLTSNLVVAVCGLIMFILMAARSRLEEARLVEKFGDAYREYQGHTGRFVPRLAGRGIDRQPV
jgi:protein-S-isoprenylcysteine O-methyltransferase Ste14